MAVYGIGVFLLNRMSISPLNSCPVRSILLTGLPYSSLIHNCTPGWREKTDMENASHLKE